MTRPTILVVDHHSASRRTLSEALRSAGYEVFLAGSGEEAVEFLKAESVDAVVMDLRMPTMSGQTLYHLILSQWPALRARVVTASEDPEEAEHQPWLRLYDLPLVTKPFAVAEVLHLVAAVTTPQLREANGL